VSGVPSRVGGRSRFHGIEARLKYSASPLIDDHLHDADRTSPRCSRSAASVASGVALGDERRDLVHEHARHERFVTLHVHDDGAPASLPARDLRDALGAAAGVRSQHGAPKPRQTAATSALVAIRTSSALAAARS
jgi:hypothetical protein